MNPTEALVKKGSLTRRCFILAILGILGLSGVHGAAPAGPRPAPTLEGTEWALVELEGKPFKPVGTATLRLDPGKKRAAGRSPVNSFGGQYELKDSSLKFGPMMATRRGGEPEAMAAESAYFTMLGNVSGWRIKDGRLELLQGEKVVAQFVPPPVAAGAKPGE